MLIEGSWSLLGYFRSELLEFILRICFLELKINFNYYYFLPVAKVDILMQLLRVICFKNENFANFYCYF